MSKITARLIFILFIGANASAVCDYEDLPDGVLRSGQSIIVDVNRLEIILRTIEPSAILNVEKLSVSGDIRGAGTGDFRITAVNGDVEIVHICPVPAPK